MDILELFEGLEAELRSRLNSQSSWGLSGKRDGQYIHDVVADELLLEPLIEEGFRVLTEESGIVGEGDITIVVDPVDGSTNASHGLPWYATSLCAVDADGPLVSLVSNLALGDRYRAIRREGLEVDGFSLVGRSSVPSDVTELKNALVSFSGLPPSHGGWRQYRTYGACALDMCAVATGTFDAFVDVDAAHGVWDYLGAWLVCKEAGAAVADGRGEDAIILSHGARRAPVAAATPELLDQVLTMRASWS